MFAIIQAGIAFWFESARREMLRHVVSGLRAFDLKAEGINVRKITCAYVSYNYYITLSCKKLKPRSTGTSITFTEKYARIDSGMQ